MSKSIPIQAAKGFAIAHDCSQVIIFAHDGNQTHIVTWGDTPEQSAQAAAGGNAIKKKWGWPEDTLVESAKVTALREELAQTQAELAEMRKNALGTKYRVHIIEGTEYERGWGCRPDGFIAFHSENLAKLWISEYNDRFNNEATAPVEYTVYNYIGSHECSESMYARAAKKHVSITRLKDLVE